MPTPDPIEQASKFLANELIDSRIVYRGASRADLESIIAAHMRCVRDRSVGEPRAWMVDSPTGDEFSYKVFASEREAQDQADEWNANHPEGSEAHEVIPLYALTPKAGAR